MRTLVLAYNLSLRDLEEMMAERGIRVNVPPFIVGSCILTPVEQDQRRNKRRIRSMLGFKSATSAETIVSGIEMST